MNDGWLDGQLVTGLTNYNNKWATGLARAIINNDGATMSRIAAQLVMIEQQEEKTATQAEAIQTMVPTLTHQTTIDIIGSFARYRPTDTRPTCFRCWQRKAAYLCTPPSGGTTSSCRQHANELLNTLIRSAVKEKVMAMFPNATIEVIGRIQAQVDYGLVFERLKKVPLTPKTSPGT